MEITVKNFLFIAMNSRSVLATAYTLHIEQKQYNHETSTNEIVQVAQNLTMKNTIFNSWIAFHIGAI